MIDLGEVLKLVNVARVALNLRPLDALPKGLRGDAMYCPLATALPGGAARSLVDSDDITFVSTEEARAVAAAWGVEPPTPIDDWVALPGPLKDFVRRFDDGEMPELEV